MAEPVSDLILKSTVKRTLPGLVFCLVPPGGRFSGFIVEHRNRYFIVTAGHAMAQAKDRLKSTLVATFGQPLTSKPLRFLRAFSTSDPVDEGDSDPEDIGIIEIDRAEVDHLKVQPFESFRLRSNLLSTPLASLIILGAPKADDVTVGRESNAIMSTLTALATVVTEDDPSRFALRHDYDPSRDIFAEFKLSALRSIDQTGGSPKLDGMSGGPVIAIPALESGRLWTLEDFEIAGLQSSVLTKRGLVRVKRSENILAFIEQVGCR